MKKMVGVLFVIVLGFAAYAEPPVKQGETQSPAITEASSNELLGKWAGTWLRPRPSKRFKPTGADFLLEIEKVDPDTNKAEIQYKYGEGRKSRYTVTFTPPDKLEWYTKDGHHYQLGLKDGKLWGTRASGRMTEQIFMEKQ